MEKRKMKKYLIIVVLFLVSHLTHAQDGGRLKVNVEGIKMDSIRPLKIGDKVPDILFGNILNYKTKKAKLSDFKGKLIILDMWSTICASCIEAFPEMEKLQSDFNGKIQILLVNPHDPKFDSEEKIKSVLEKTKTRTGFYPKLPIPIHDSILNAYFPHQSVPHQVWIDKNGKVLVITDLKNTTRENIIFALNGEKLSIPVKDDWAYDKEKPLFVDGNGGDFDAFLFRSIFTEYNKEINSCEGVRKDINGNITGMYMINKPLWYMLVVAYSDLMKGFLTNRIIIDVKNDPDKVARKSDTRYMYCYDLVTPPTPPNLFDQNRYLKEDIKRYFKVGVYKESRKLKSLIVTTTDQIIKSYSKQKMEFYVDKGTIKKVIHNYSIGNIIKFLSAYFNKPLIDETGLSDQLIDITFPDNFEFADSDGLLKVLEKSGFCIWEEEREMEVLIITDMY
ncbi:MAG: TlpA family protein disulfide reductase [Chitinophagales bacterium]|nr:TlpA family protein disulfide reductase [Chitinophagales bacterium]